MNFEKQLKLIGVLHNVALDYQRELTGGAISMRSENRSKAVDEAKKQLLEFEVFDIVSPDRVELLITKFILFLEYSEEGTNLVDFLLSI
jgi:hypothetical protein